MTELEKMQRAKMYLDKMANGINPIDDKAVAEDDALNNVRVSRCLFYVSDILRQVIDSKGFVGKTVKVKTSKKPFNLSLEEIKRFVPSSQPVSISELTAAINSLADLEKYKKMSRSAIHTWLVDVGLMEIRLSSDGKKLKRPTIHGKELGIFTEDRIGKSGSYVVVMYDAYAQQFIVDNITAIINYANVQKLVPVSKGPTWSMSHDECLIDLYNKNVSFEEIAITLKRTEVDIKERIKELGLIAQKEN